MKEIVWTETKDGCFKYGPWTIAPVRQLHLYFLYKKLPDGSTLSFGGFDELNEAQATVALFKRWHKKCSGENAMRVYTYILRNHRAILKYLSAQ